MWLLHVTDQLFSFLLAVIWLIVNFASTLFLSNDRQLLSSPLTDYRIQLNRQPQKTSLFAGLYQSIGR